MTDGKEFTKKLFLELHSNGIITLAKDYLWDGCDTPEIDPEIDLTPVSIKKLTQILSDLYLNQPEKEDINQLKQLLVELNGSADIIASTIQTIKAKFL